MAVGAATWSGAADWGIGCPVSRAFLASYIIQLQNVVKNGHLIQTDLLQNAISSFHFFLFFTASFINYCSYSYDWQEKKEKNLSSISFCFSRVSSTFFPSSRRRRSFSIASCFSASSFLARAALIFWRSSSAFCFFSSSVNGLISYKETHRLLY